MKNLDKANYIPFVPFLKHSTIHGLQHIVSPKKDVSEHALWTVAIITAISGAIYTGLLTWDRFQSNPTVISLDRDYKYWNTSFPAMTICPSFKQNDQEILSLANNPLYYSENKEKLIKFMVELRDANYLTFNKVNSFNDINPKNYVEMVMNTTFDFKYGTMRSNLQTPRDMDWMSRSLSELGVCYTFNSKIANYFDPRFPRRAVKFRYNSLVGNPFDGDVYAQLINMSSGGQIYIHNDEEMPDITSKSVNLPFLDFKMIQVTALTVVTSEEVASLTVHQRKCRFVHESSLLMSPSIYSYNLCRMDCRLQISYSLCQCVPYFYWTSDHTRFKICDVEGMHCLAKHKEKLLHANVKGKDNTCHCLPPCEETNYFIEMDEIRKWLMGTQIKWGMVKFPRIRLKRDILFGFTDLLVAIGGTAGLFLGCSVLSFIEMTFWLIQPIVKLIFQLIVNKSRNINSFFINKY